MNSKQRVQIALNHQEPDRVPMAMSAGTFVVQRLKEHFGVETDRELLQALNIDIYDIRGIDYKHGGIGAKYIGPDNLGIPADWSGEFFILFGYQEELMETQFGMTYSMGTAAAGRIESWPNSKPIPGPSPTGLITPPSALSSKHGQILPSLPPVARFFSTRSCSGAWAI